MSNVQLQFGSTDDGRKLAIAFEMRGEDIVVLDVEVVGDKAEADEWFARVKLERPWEERQ